MTRIEELSECLVDKFDVSKQQASQFAADFFAIIRERLEIEKLVKVKGLGTFKLAEISARESIDVNTGERITLDGRLKITFTPENAVKERINSPFSSFETMDIEDNADFSEIDSKYNDESAEAVQESQESQEVIPDGLRASGQEVQEVQEVIPDGHRASGQEVQEPEPTPEPEPASFSEQPAPSAPNENIEKIVRQIYQEEKLNTEIKDSHRAINRLSWILGTLLVVVLIILGIVCFKLFFNDGAQPEKAKVTVVEKAHVVKKADVVETADTLVSKVQKSQEVIPNGHRASGQKVENPNAKYDTDPRVRTGAYVILGVSETVTVNRNQSLASLSKYYLGDGMECYIEALNPGKKEFKKGETVKLPKLETKRHWRKTHKQ